jgi:hypothetical protein
VGAGKLRQAIETAMVLDIRQKPEGAAEQLETKPRYLEGRTNVRQGHKKVPEMIRRVGSKAEPAVDHDATMPGNQRGIDKNHYGTSIGLNQEGHPLELLVGPLHLSLQDLDPGARDGNFCNLRADPSSTRDRVPAQVVENVPQSSGVGNNDTRASCTRGVVKRRVLKEAEHRN